MRKITFVIMSMFIILSTPIASASVDTISVTTYAKGNSVTAYVKNFDNNQSHSVKLELQKDGKIISSKSITVNKNQQAKVVFNLSSKGKYQIKYTVKSKSDYTSKFGK